MNIEERAKRSPEILRAKRTRLFRAFDIYKQNVSYGLVDETNDRHEEIKAWYNKCRELDYEAINNPPLEIKKYL